MSVTDLNAATIEAASRLRDRAAEQDRALEIEVRVSPIWLTDANYQRMIDDGGVPFLWRRVASICCSEPNLGSQADGYPWTLDRSNDWKAGLLAELGREGARDVFVVFYRYGTDRSEMHALKVVLEWFLK